MNVVLNPSLPTTETISRFNKLVISHKNIMLYLVPQVPEAIIKCKLVITELYIDNTTFYALPQIMTHLNKTSGHGRLLHLTHKTRLDVDFRKFR